MLRFALTLAFMVPVCGLAPSARADTSFLSQAATCTGRLSAYLELHWAHDDPRADSIATLHRHMTDLMFALIREDTDRLGRTLRTEAKVSFRALLVAAGSDAAAPKQRQLATLKARYDLRTCAALIRPDAEVDAALGLSENGALLTANAGGADLRTASR